MSIRSTQRYLAVFTLSLTVLALELVYTRILSTVFYGNIVFLAVSAALLGVSLGGVAAALDARQPEATRDGRQRIFALLYGCAIIGSLYVFLQLGQYVQFTALALALSAMALPFACASFCLATQFNDHRDHISRLYFADLLGASLGAVVGITLLNLLGEINGLFVIGLLAFTPFIALSASAGRRIPFGFWMLPVTVAFLFLLNTQFDFIAIGNRKSLLGQVYFSRSNSYSKITVGSTGQDATMLWAEIDSDASTPMVKFDGNFEWVSEFKNYLTSAPHKLAGPGARTLIIGPGGGIDVLVAILHGNPVTGVEINPIIVNDVMRGAFAEYAGNLYARDDVEIIVAEGRSYLGKTDAAYEIIQLPLVDTWAAAAAGAFTLAENNLYTVEAFTEYFNHLTADGFLSITRWELDGYRLIVLAAEAMEKIGLTDFRNHVVIFQDASNGNLYHYLFKKSAFRPQELATLNQFTTTAGHQLVYPLAATEPSPFRQLIETEERERISRDFPIDISLTTDDKPYFFNQVKLRDFLWPSVSDDIYYRKNNSNLLLVMSVTALFTLTLFILPAAGGRKGVGGCRRGTNSLVYFGCIGLGFMFLEMVLIQKFILFLEHPVYSYSVVLVSLLFFSSLGSHATAAVAAPRQRRQLRFALLAVALLAFAYRYLLPLVINGFLGSRLEVKILLAVITVMPIAFFMGMAFPLGIKLVDPQAQAGLIPWLWAVNGAASVLASVATIFVAIYFGFSLAFTLGAVAYLAALLTTAVPAARPAER